MKNWKKTMAALLAAILCIGLLAACGKKEDPGTPTPGGEYVYRAEYLDLTGADVNITGVNNSCYTGGKLVFIAQVPDGMESETYTYIDENGEEQTETYEYEKSRSAMFSVNTDGTGLKELSGYVPTEIPQRDEGGGSANIEKMTADAQGNIWILESVYTYGFNLPEDFDEFNDDRYNYYESKQSYNLRKLDTEGTEVVRLDMAEVFGSEDDNGYIYISGMEADKDGNVYIADGNLNVLYVLDAQGSLLFKVENDSWFQGMTRVADGSVVVSTYDQTAQKAVLRTVDLSTKGLGASSDAPYSAYNLYPGGGDYDFYFQNGTNFQGYKMKTGVSETLFNWINIDVDSNNVSGVTLLDDGKIVAFYTDRNRGVYGRGGMMVSVDATSGSNLNGEGPSTQLLVISKVNASELPEKTTLSYACMYLDYNVRSQILAFNRSNEKYRIEVRDYSEYNTQEDYSAGLTKLTTEIVSGKVPDLLSTDSLPITQYAAKGMLEDLYPFLDADTELGGREALVQSALAALETDGKLYQVAPSYSIQTAIALSSVVGDVNGWTPEDLRTALASLPENARVASKYMTKESFLSYICQMNLEKFVDWQSGKCNFDDPSFIELLKLTDLFPAEQPTDDDDQYVSDRVAMQRGDQLLSISGLYGLTDYVWNFGADLTKVSFVGFPTVDGSNGNAFSFDTGLAMSSNCKDKEGAWSFIRIFLTEDYQTNNLWSLPINKNVLDKQVEEQMTPEYETDPETGLPRLDENGRKIEIPKFSTWDEISDDPIDIYAMDQATADKLLGLINDTTATVAYDSNIYDIVSEECGAYFAGQKSAEETAKMIQSRVSLYVNEQK